MSQIPRQRLAIVTTLFTIATSVVVLATSQNISVFSAHDQQSNLIPQAESELLNPETTALYNQLNKIRQDYQLVIDQILNDETPWAIESLSAVSDALRAVTNECDETPHCELNRFLDTFSDLAQAQTLALKKMYDPLAKKKGEGDTAHSESTEQSSTDITLRELGQVASLLSDTGLSSLVKVNGPVRAALDDWLTWMRPVLMDSYENYQFLRNEIAPVYEAAGLPEALLFAMIATESRGRVHSFSRAGAAGPLQFMRATGRAYGLREVDGFDTRLDPVAATKANVAYLNAQLKILNNDLEKTLAAYNGGENRLRRLHRRYKGSSLWDSRFYYSLPRETRDYVPRILAAAHLFLHANDYNLQWPVYQTETTEITLSRNTSLGELAICLGQQYNRNGWFRTLRNLNPRVEANVQLEAGEQLKFPVILTRVYNERCTSGQILDRALALYEANYPDGSNLIPYIVKRGDTLGKIASRLPCVSTSELADINGIRSPRFLIRIGQQLRIPNC
jgi:membrane-bound lytic murein transglycosylase D